MKHLLMLKPTSLITVPHSGLNLYETSLNKTCPETLDHFIKCQLASPSRYHMLCRHYTVFLLYSFFGSGRQVTYRAARDRWIESSHTTVATMNSVPQKECQEREIRETKYHVYVFLIWQYSEIQGLHRWGKKEKGRNEEITDSYAFFLPAYNSFLS